MPVPAPDPLAVRAASLQELARLGLALPPETFPLVWDPDDQVELRSTIDLERRAVILFVVLERTFGMPPDKAESWLDRNDLTPDVTEPEWAWITEEIGDRRSFALHLDALAGLAWTLGLIKSLDPLAPPQSLVELFPDLLAEESFADWQGRTLSAPRDPAVVAAALDLHYCLDWAFLKLSTDELPGAVDANAIGQRRWALEWSAVFIGPHHDPPGGWEEVDLST
ncbi:MAG TPA: DUF4272 domain-containing protein [Micromonosporaceae bacterium]|nr:DUF4272 domain-containing protein [Micromonosporaceae bacterium]HCU52145.1 DUF4272 domain-containing protein [Micromonosporaceae bacterium]